MAEPARAPYDGYTLYKVWHKQEERWMANLVKHYANDRTTMSLARYMMSVHLGRILGQDEHVDHVNNIKSDDRVENFQILTRSENTRKKNALTPKKVTTCVCSICNAEFLMDTRDFRFRPNATCSVKCGRLSASKKLRGNSEEKDKFFGQKNKYKNPEFIEFVLELRNAGYTYKQIGLLVNAPKTTVLGVCNKNYVRSTGN